MSDTVPPYSLSTAEFNKTMHQWHMSAHDMMLFYTWWAKEIWLLDYRIGLDAYRKLPNHMRALYTCVGLIDWGEDRGKHWEDIVPDANDPDHTLPALQNCLGPLAFWLKLSTVPADERVRYRHLRLEMGQHEVEVIGEYKELYRIERGKAFLRDQHMAWGEVA